ncbi:MAG: AAA family ATPase [Candidatus Latescibacteria bacterium]|nr:AAA family ATPase [bacterium]MBD3424009.1 AAA family ATPase [Candidatus Latescibacterota bacterium]
MSSRGELPVDQEQRERAVEDTDRSLCLEAGAGTGKTTLLVKRYISIIREGKAACPGIVAITFTEAAASEMKERIRRKLAAMLQADSMDPEYSPGSETIPDEVELRFRDAIRQIEAAPVTTIHSFSSSVIRDYPVEAGIDPDFNMLNEVEQNLFLDDCWNDYLAQSGPSFESTIGSFLRIGGSLGKLAELAGRYYHSRFERNVTWFGKDEREPRTTKEAGSRESFYDLFRSFTEKLEKMASRHCVDEGDLGKRDIGKLREHLETASGLNRVRREEYLLGVKISSSSGARSKWNPDEISDRQKELRGELAGRQEEYRCRYMDSLRDQLEEIFCGYLDFVEERKREEGTLDFDDLLIRMRQLMNNDEVVRSLRKRYRYILVDEFQDTNSIQAEIVFILAGLMGDGEKRLEEPSSLFIVGDPKQSIYRFRKADVEVYEEVKKDFSDEGAYLRIQQNFRSGGGVLEWVNSTFRHLIKKPDSGRYQPEYEPVFPFRQDENTGVYLLELDKGDDRIKVGELREKEGIAAARLIRHLVDSGREIWDLEAEEFRPVKYGDIAMIYRATTGLEHYEMPLKAEGIPYVVSGGGFFFAAQEVRDLANAVWAVENHWDPVYLVAVLRSVLFGFSDEEIYLFRKAGGELDYLSGKVPEGGKYKPFKEAFELMRDLHRNRNLRGAAGTVRELIRRTGYRELTVFMSHSRQRTGNIEKVIRKGREFDSGFHSFRKFALWFRDQEKLGTREGEYSLLDEGQNAVRLLTIHKSKGQQFPVVIMINLEQGISHREQFFMEGGSGAEFRITGDWHTSRFEEFKNRDRDRDLAEIKRLLYVSATRAGDILVIPDVRNISRGRSYIGLLKDYLPPVDGNSPPDGADSDEADAGRLVRRISLSSLPPYSGIRMEYRKLPPPGSALRVEGERRFKQWQNGRNKLLEMGAGAVPVITPSSGKESPDADGFDDKQEPGFGGRRASAFGNAFHRVMEVIDLSDTGRLEEVAGVIACEEGVEDLKVQLCELAGRTISSDIIAGLSEADMVLREVPFTIPLESDRDGAEFSFLSGKVDLLFRKGGIWTALDYKTDHTEKPVERFRRYRPQAMMYLAGLKKLGIELKGGIIFYFVRPGIPVTLDPDDLEGSGIPPGITGLI